MARYELIIVGHFYFMRILLRNIRSGKRRALITELNSITKKQLEIAVDTKVKPAIIKSFDLVVKDWKHQPEFKARKEIRPQYIKVIVFPTGEHAQIFIWVDQGTEDHMVPGSGNRIYPVRAKALSFNLGGKYIPKTLAKPARTFSGGGRVEGGTPVAFASVAAHMVSGIEPREFTQTIAKDTEPSFRSTIENVFRQISRQLEE